MEIWQGRRNLHGISDSEKETPSPPALPDADPDRIEHGFAFYLDDINIGQIGA